jgi:hypothetical protein
MLMPSAFIEKNDFFGFKTSVVDGKVTVTDTPELKAAIRDHARYLRAIAVETIPEAFGTQSKSAA